MTGPEQEPIAVIGTACRFPGGADTPSKLWDLLQAPRNLVKRVPGERFDSTGYFHPNGSHHGATDCQEAYFLDEDVTRFDNAFFNIQAAEAEAIDPQQRLLMETIYDSLCAGGQTIEALRGSSTAVYVGQMCDDWAQMTNRDWDLVPTYGATGQSRAIISNRVSYFFDWHGPSMTIDTACSSSLVAVHQGVTAIRNGECPIAIAAGANLVLSPGMWIAESKLHMLSPTGTSKMWDAAADGYARGEGIAAIILKPLSAALRDGDNIDCLIRGTGVNQDGRTPGLTMPSNIAQAALIRETYKRAGLDINDPKDRPQFFHAHGTGTPAGDPQEAEAISTAFFSTGEVKDPLFVGSIKTVIGHTEGTAGLASLIGTALAMRHGVVPPNLHFETLSPRVAPFCSHLQVPTKATPWPSPVDGQPRRASINSFGFGGTNAHAIIEAFKPEAICNTKLPIFTPLTVSAATSSALRTMLSDLKTYLSNHPEANLRDVAYTLQSRRSTLGFRKAILCRDVDEAVGKIESLLADDASGEASLSSRYVDVLQPSILGVFTGQGAQWARMSAQLIKESPFASSRIAELDAALSSLPEGDKPDWTLREQLLADASVSRLSEAAISQPLCTAVQIVLVDLIKATGIKLAAVVGHSSGEIAAAYAAGFLSATNAIRVAYYRGVYAKLARASSQANMRGAMMAVGTSYEDAVEFCHLEDFEGRIQVAARNSSTSMTLSGDEDVIDEAVEIFKAEGKFARRLQVDTAYHSHHMAACATPYLDALTRCNITAEEGNATKWFSSVVDGQVMTQEIVKENQYWVDNMTNAVLFAPAVETAVTIAGPFDLAVEFGPHPALKGPCLDTVEEATGQKIPYTGLLSRNKNDVEELAAALGYVWTNLGAGSIDFDGFEKLISSSSAAKRQVNDLPTYPFDHSRSFYTLTRFSGNHVNVHAPPHPLLGRRCVETEATDEVSWRNVLRPSENSWLHGHQLQGQTVFPGMGYVAMAVEAAAALAGNDRPIGLISLENVVIGRALAFTDDNVGMESKVSLKVRHFTEHELCAQMTCHSGLPFDGASPLALNFSTTVTVAFHEPRPDTLPVARTEEINLVEAEPERLYAQFSALGYNYSPPFAGVQAISRKMGFATGEIDDVSGDNWEDNLIIHPGWLDCAVQTSFAAYCYPQDMRLWALHVPTAIRSLVINPYYHNRGTDRNRRYQYQTSVREIREGPVEVDIDVFSGTGASQAYIQFESVELKPFAPPGPRDDTPLFSSFDYKLAGPDAVASVEGDDLMPPHSEAVLMTAERVGFYYLRKLYETITPAEASATLPHFRHLLDFSARMLTLVEKREHPNVPYEALKDSQAFIRSLIAKNHESVDIRLLEAAGENLIAEVRRNGSILEHVMKDRLLDRFYEESAALAFNNVLFARTVAQVAHRYPRLRILEVGAGTGGVTSRILPLLGDNFTSYTYTDISAGFFNRVQDRFRDFADRMVFSTFNMEKPPSEQGFEEGSYDLILASNVLHATGMVDDMMSNVRRLLRPGGYLIALEIITNYSLGIDQVMGALPGWWAGAEVDPVRRDGPSLSTEQWDKLSRKHGFGGLDTHTPIKHKLQGFSVLVFQAVDDRVSAIRQPLAAPAPAISSGSTELALVGGATLPVKKLADEIQALLQSRYTAINRFETLEELNDQGLAQGSSVLSLTELDQQFFEDRKPSKLEALKNLWRNGRNILWVTRGARGDNPYSAMILGLARVIRYEQPHLNLQILDFDVTPKSQVLAESILRLELGEKAKKEGADILWTVEPEVHYIDEQLMIPRLYPHSDANARYNTYRRTVFKEANPLTSTVVLEPAKDGSALRPSLPSPLRVSSVARHRSGKLITLQVEQSVLQAVKVGESGFFSLCAGADIDSGEKLVALCDGAVESRICVPAEWTMRAPETTSTTLASAAAHLIARSIVATAPRHGTVLVHEADEVLRNALDQEASREGISVKFTTAIERAKLDAACIFVHEKLPLRLVQRIIPRDVTYLVNLAPSSDSSKVLARSLPLNAATATVTDFLRLQADINPDFDTYQPGSALKAAWNVVSRQRRISLREQVPVLPLEEVVNYSPMRTSLSVVNWNTPSVLASVLPIDHGTIFREDGTYLFFGLSGELGQSLCGWMVAHGARNIVLSSRRPNVNPLAIAALEAAGATIKVMAVDVTQRDSLRACYDRIRAEMPPVIGVANGAMILEDIMFDDLEYSSIERTLPPKVDGSALLDELFYDTPLDFFVLFTSLANIVGNTGQSTYVMANQFMSALAAQRRDVRGLAGSDMAISSLQGLGYIEHALLDRDYFVRLGYRNISEQDFHNLFAEAVLAGRPGSKGNSEMATGLIPFRDGPTIHAQIRTDPKFGHYMMQDPEDDVGADGRAGANGAGKVARPRVRLAAVKTREEAFAVVQESFIDRLKRILMIPSADVVDPLMSLVELGADSIMAVDVRAWFLKELDVDVPVLKILGPGETIVGLVEEAMERIPVEIFDLGKVDEPSAQPAIAIASLPQKLQQALNATESTVVSSSVTDSASSPAANSTPLTPSEIDDSDIKQLGEVLLERAEETIEEVEEAPKAWRKAIVDSSSEHTEQMTFGQKRFWFLYHYIDDPTTFNIAYLGKLTGRLRIGDLASAIEMATQRHESLRTRFFWSEDDTKTPMQGILSKTLVRLETATIDSADQAMEELDAMRDYQWDLGDWVPLRMRLLSLSDTEHYLVIGTHHISLDGHSFSVLMLDIQEAYNRRGRPLSPLPNGSQARAFGEQQRLAHETGHLKPAIDHYRTMLPLQDLTRPIELFSFARTQVRPPLDRYGTHVARQYLDAATAAKLKQLARSHRATSFHAYLATLQALVLRLLPADTTDKVFIGMADANRLDSKFMGSIGNFLNVLPLRFDRARRQNVGEAIEAARDMAYGALKHSSLPFDLLLEELDVPRSNAWAPVFQIFMDYRLVVKDHAQKNWAGCRISDETWHPSKSGYDVALEVVEDPEGVMIAVHVQKSLYDAAGAELLARSYVNALTEVAKNGDKFSVQKLEKWHGDDTKRALEVARDTKLSLQWPATVAHRIDEVIAQHPNSTALKDGYGRVLTYKAFNERVESIAQALQERFPKNSEQAVVGVFQMPSADWICSLVAILRIGAIYMPLDLRNSIPRLRSNVAAARPAAFLVDNETASKTVEIGVNDTMVTINVNDLAYSTERKIETSAKASEPAYVIFTSGSTGEPKGILVKHAGLRVNLEGYHRAWDIASLANVVLQQTALSFDASLLQIFAALTTGGCLLVAPADARGDPAEITRLMAEHEVTMTQATPSEYDMWFRFAPESLRRCTSWKAAWFGGERAGPGVLEGFRKVCEALPKFRVFTSYGPTESTISAMKGEANVRDPTLTVPVPGRVLPNYSAYIVDDEMRPLPLGVPGEIVLGGAGVGANEYLRRPDLTAAAFLPDKFTSDREDGWGRMYRTGDYGRLDARGYLTVEGRIAGDTQVKLRGFRIELAEIERVMVKEAAGALIMAVVTLRGGTDDQEGFLAAHVVFDRKDADETTTARLVEKLRSRLPLCLPQYMCPAIIVPLDEVPLTAHHKVDRRAVEALSLPKVERSTIEQDGNLTPTELRLAALWDDILPPRAAGIALTSRYDFFRAGGNSLLLVKLQANIKKEFGDAPRLSKLMNASDLGTMAALLDSGVVSIDWDKEIAAELPIDAQALPQQTSNDALSILITGSTGSLGQRVTQRLLANKKVARILCLIRPTEGRDFSTIFSDPDNKISVISTDLPSLPADERLANVDVVLHCAADRNFWDAYSAVKPVNVGTVQELTKLSLATGASVHVLSSGAVALYEADVDQAGTINLSRPSPDDGYVSSKWVAERYLAQVARSTGLSITAHRPTTTLAKHQTQQEIQDLQLQIAQDMLRLSMSLGVRPDFAKLGGTIHVASLNDVADAITTAVVTKTAPDATNRAMTILNHHGSAQIQTEALATCAGDLFAQPEHEALRKLPAVPALHWVGLAKRAGLFEWFFTAQNLVMEDGEGRRVVTKR